MSRRDLQLLLFLKTRKKLLQGCRPDCPPPGPLLGAAWTGRLAAKAGVADRGVVVHAAFGFWMAVLAGPLCMGVVAAVTTSLPEQFGGPRNWDYRYCWVRDATLTLLALMNTGYYEEARAWREWLLRAVAGSPKQMQIMYD